LRALLSADVLARISVSLARHHDLSSYTLAHSG
jgi:hypothetical protein